MWNKTIDCANEIIKRFEASGIPIPLSSPKNFLTVSSAYSSEKYRRAHIDVIDVRKTHKLWIMHCTIFPHTDDCSPIFGFDTVCGPTRISGAFHDFSSAGHPHHPMMRWFDERVSSLNWKKERELPEWAKNIFSPAMIAVGAVSDEKEADQFISVGLENLDYYLNNVGKTRDKDSDYSTAQNYYCQNQRMNPHTPRTMKMLGLTDEENLHYMNEVLFPLV